jgi:hypothetical protein
VGDRREAEAPAAIFDGLPVDGSSADVAKNPHRHAPQRTSAAGDHSKKTSLSSKHIAHNVVSWTGGAPDSTETGLGEINGNVPEEDFGPGVSQF